jgi:hypothetical protein
LKSKSEERETWTAESLRAAKLAQASKVAGRDFGGLSFQVNTLGPCVSTIKAWDLVKRCDQPD